VSDRIDKVMVDRGLVLTRSQASMLINQGDVLCNGKVVTKAGLKVAPHDEITIKAQELYVSRGAYKLLAALEEFQIDLTDKIVADIGASTGGFTQVCLQKGASKVYAIDVGQDQLAELLKNDPRVINREQTNIKFPIELPELVDYCVVDVSFISITKVFHNIAKLLKKDGAVIVLIKPQFEAGIERVGKNGLISEKDRKEIVEEVRNWFKQEQFMILQESISPIVGNKSGNTEYLWLIKPLA
jgi:23S rRNA (cytidine1920-2'-O)/16S rRNA (cytidine1409-2'-O)-methyltransferase